MNTARIIPFARPASRVEGPVSPFRHQTPRRPLSARAIQHRRRMLEQLVAARLASAAR